MRILLVVPDCTVGGITSSAVNFANEVSSRGNEVYFLDMSSKIADKNMLNENIRIVELKGKDVNWKLGVDELKNSKGLSRIKFALLGIIKKLTIKSGLWYKIVFSQFCQHGEFDVAIAYRQCDPCYSFVLNKVKAKKKIAFVHAELTYMGDISSWKKHMTSFDKVAYVSSAVKEQFVAVYPELAKNACTIYNMFDVERIKSLAEQKPTVEFDKSVKNIVTVARIDNAFKQIHWIVEICKELKQKTKAPFHWYVVGDGPDFDSTVELAKQSGVCDVLTFLGHQDNPYSLMKQSDFTVLVSKSEAYPMVVFESFILQKPIVVARFSSIIEMMESGKQGIIAEQSIDSISDSIVEMIDVTSNNFENCCSFLKKNIITNEKPYRQFLDCIGEV